MQQNYPKLKLQAISGIKWNMVAQALVYLITLVGTAVLSRIITPTDYGLFGMIIVIANLANMIVGMGVAMAVIQDNTLNQEDISSIFWFNIILALLVGSFFFIGAPYIAEFYNQPRLTFITRLFSLIFLLHGAKAVPTGLLSKEINFKYLAYGQIIANIVSFSVAIGLALNDYGVYSLVIQAIILNLLILTFNLYYSRWTPDLTLKKESIKKIKDFSINYLPSQLIDFFATNLDVVLIGKYLGARKVGLYGKAIALVMLPVSLVSLVFNKSFYPIFSKIQDDVDAIRKIYLKSSKMMILVLLPIYMLIIVLAHEVIFVLFGSQWVEATPLVEVLGVFAIFYSVNSFNETFLLSQGKANWLLKINILDKVILVILFITALKYGLIYFAYAKLIVTILFFIVKYVMAGLIHKVSIWNWLKSIDKIFLSFVLSLIICLTCKYYLVDEQLWIRVIAVSGTSIGTFVIMLQLLRDDSFKEISNLFKGYLKI